MFSRSWIPVALACTLAACAPPGPPPVKAQGPAVVPAGALSAAGTVSGTVALPTTLIHDGGVVVYRLHDVGEQPVPRAKVYLADATGAAIAGIPAVTADTQGHYVITQVPPDYTFVVAADVMLKGGKKATLRSLATARALGTSADVTAATTIMTAGLLDGQPGADLGEFDPMGFAAAVKITNQWLTRESVPDLADPAGVQAFAKALVAEATELKDLFKAVRDEVREVRRPFAPLRQALADREKGLLPSPGSLAPLAPAAKATSTPAPNATPTATAAAACTADKAHHFATTSFGVAKMEFRVTAAGVAPTAQQLRATAVKDDAFAATVPEGCAHSVLLYTVRGELITIIENFVIPTGAPDQVNVN